MFPSPAYFDPSMAAALSAMAPEMLAASEAAALPFQSLEQFDFSHFFSTMEATSMSSLAYPWQDMHSLVFNAHLSMRYPSTTATTNDFLNAANLSSALLLPEELPPLATDHINKSAEEHHQVSQTLLFVHFFLFKFTLLNFYLKCIFICIETKCC